MPSAQANVVDYQDQTPSVISVDAEGNYFINAMTSPGTEEIEDYEPVSLNVAINQILARKEIYPDMQVFVKGDKKVEYEKVIEIIALLKQYSKIDKVGFMTENPN